MGRRPDPPGVQRAKGNSNRRPAATAKRELEAAKLAALLTSSFGQPVTDAPPAILQHDPVAVAMWRDLAPILSETHRLKPQHKPMFYTFCIYYAQWQMTNAELSGKGYTQQVKTVAGGMMTRINPLARFRDDALKHCLELSKRFGLTPADEYSLFKDQAAAGSSNPWLFGGEALKRTASDDASTSEVEAPSLIGSMANLDSKPPGTSVQ